MVITPPQHLNASHYFLLSLVFILILYTPPSHAAFQLESRGESCSLRTTIALPSINLGCDADSRSGNASSWNNPNIACDMSFEMLSLPSLGDITAGITAGVCNALKGLKSMTYDKAINKINDKIPQDVLGDLDLDLDLTEHISVGD